MSLYPDDIVSLCQCHHVTMPSWVSLNLSECQDFSVIALKKELITTIKLSACLAVDIQDTVHSNYNIIPTTNDFFTLPHA